MRRSKHNARKVTQYIGNQECHFDSLAERNYALWLEKEKVAGRVARWVHHPGAVVLHGLNRLPVGRMEPDFSVWWPQGDHEYHEVKGMPTAAWRLKRALYEQEYGDAYVVIDAGQVDPPALFDDRRKRKAARKKARAGKSPGKSPGKKRGGK